MSQIPPRKMKTCFTINLSDLERCGAMSFAVKLDLKVLQC